MPFYEKGDVRIHYEEAGSGFPLLVIPGGGLNSTVAGLAAHPFNPMGEFKGEYRVIAADLRNANGGQSSGPLEIDRPWDAYADDHIGLMDHLGIANSWCWASASAARSSGTCCSGARAGGRRRAGAAERLPTGDARPLLPEQHQGLGPAAVRTPGRLTMAGRCLP